MDSIEMFPGFSNESIRFWCFVGNIMGTISFYVDHIHFVVPMFGIILGLLHLIVLTRKSMRALTINLFLAGIAVSDLVRMICIIVIIIPFFDLRYLSSNRSSGCSSPNSSLAVFSRNFSLATAKTVEQLSIWFGVIMAIIRALVIKFPTNVRINALIKAKHSIHILLITTILIIPFWIPHYSQELALEPGRWIPLSNCLVFSENSTKIQFVFEDTTIFGSTEVYIYALVIEGVVFELIPSIILPIATVVLIYYLRKNKKPSVSIKSLSNHKETLRSMKLVTFMTISFLISTTPHGLMYVFGPLLLEMRGILMIYSRFGLILVFLTTVNGVIHFSVYYFMSSRYRKIAAEIFAKGNNSNSTFTIHSTGTQKFN